MNASISFRSLRKCFAGKFRSPSLGAMHLDKGIYVDQLARWLHNFPKASFYITSLERYAADPGAERRRISSFLGIRPPYQGENLSTIALLMNPNHLKSDQPLSPSAMKALRDFYRPHTERLHELLSRRLPHAVPLMSSWPSWRV